MKTLLLLIFLLCGCASTVPTGGMQASAPAAPDKASVYVFHATAALVSESLPLLVDGKKVGVLPLRSYTWFQCEPGTYDIAVRDALISHRMLAATEVSVAAGDTVYLKYVLNPRPNELGLVGGLIGDVVSGKQVSGPDPLIKVRQEDAEKMIKNYQLVGNTVSQKKEPNQSPEPTSGLRPAAAHL